MPKLIQEQFGEVMLEAMREFARKDLGDPAGYELTYFNHVGDGALRTTLAETMYGARWIYKLGLALLVRDAEQLAHVRAQILDYSSVCEGLLSDMVRHAIVSHHVVGAKHLVNSRGQAINWASGITAKLTKQTFFWFIEVAEEEAIISPGLATRLQTLRKERNTIHLRSRTYNAYLGASRSAFGVLTDTIQATRDWRNAHP